MQLGLTDVDISQKGLKGDCGGRNPTAAHCIVLVAGRYKVRGQGCAVSAMA
jgi:hypothetical protein